MPYVIKEVRCFGDIVSVTLKPTSGVLSDGSGGPGDYTDLSVPYGTPNEILKAIDLEVKRRQDEAVKSAELNTKLTGKSVGYVDSTQTA